MKGRRQKGFTLVETLAAMLIVSLLSVALVAGVSAAINVRSGELFDSESELLASAVNTALGDLLHYSTYAETEREETSFSNPGYGILRGHLLLKDGRFYINTADCGDGDADATLLSLVSSGTYTNMKIDSFTLEYDQGLGAFTGQYLIQGSWTEQTKQITFAFRPVNG